MMRVIRQVENCWDIVTSTYIEIKAMSYQKIVENRMLCVSHRYSLDLINSLL